MTIAENTFAEACYNQNSMTELSESLRGQADPADMQEWGIESADQYYSEIKAALAELLQDAEDNGDVTREALIAEWINAETAEIDDDGDIWISGPMTGHWLSNERIADFYDWLAAR